MDFSVLPQKKWYKTLPPSQRELLKLSILLLKNAEKTQERYFDYAFVIMPAAKAYEGFVKDTLFKLGLISEEQYLGKRFRVGKSLNPELEKNPHLKKEALYQELVATFGDEAVPERLWSTWRDCRNRLLHYFSRGENVIGLPQARVCIECVIGTMEFVATHQTFQQ